MTNRLFGLISGLVAILSCSIICGAGCDLLVPGQCMGDAGPYGPCIDNTKCTKDLICFTGLAGHMCVPKQEPNAEDVACASNIGDGDLFTEQTLYGAWLISCDNDGDCRAGTVCEENIGACLHPYDEHDYQPTPGADLGPCQKGTCEYPANQCLVASDGVGDICWNPDRPEWLVPCSDADQFCPNGQVCSVADAICVWP